MAIVEIFYNQLLIRSPSEFRVSNQNEERDANQQILKIPWISVLGPKLKKIYKDKGLTTIFSSSANLMSLLCNNKNP